MHSVRPLRLALLVLVVLAALPAAAVKAAPRMPIGFYDDPSFRWASASSILSNLAAAKAAHSTIIHALADWSQLAPEKPANPLDGDDPAYQLSDLDALVRTAPRYNQQVLITISNTPKWANGGQTVNHPPTRLSDLTNFAQMLAARYNGRHPGFGAVTRWAVWNEPNLQLFLTPQFGPDGHTNVSGKEYAKLVAAAYKGIKAGNPRALVAAGETSNRGHNRHTGGVSDSTAPATFARAVAVANPHLQFDAWSTHPYPSEYRFGPSQRVSYPNVGLTNLNKLGDSLRQWFHRRVPLWITEWGEQTAPEHSGGVSRAQQAKDAATALQLAAANPYVEMFVWFIFRDSTGQTWFSGLKTKGGQNKPAYAAFARTAKGIDGQTIQVSPGAKSFKVTIDVPFLAYHDSPGAVVGVDYKVFFGKSNSAEGQPQAVISPDQTITFTVKFRPQKGFYYLMIVEVNDKHGQRARRVIALVA
jgi:Cellulase (glycosyl hydrolase family 5)